MTAQDSTPDDHRHEHDLGLAHDLPTLLNRRRALGLLTGVGLSAALAACGALDRVRDEPMGTASPTAGMPPPDQTGARPGTQVGEGDIPAETGGPFPADGSNGRNVLVQSGIVRSDITGSFGGAKGVATGVPTTLALTLLDHDNGKTKPLTGVAIYVWHCDSKGRYSMYDEHLAHQNYLRGLQVADEKGQVTFRTIFPATYGGRWPHIHFEVFESEESAVRTRGLLRTSQIALPEKACRQVYEADGYETSRSNINLTSLRSDVVFRDGYDLQLAKVTGSVDDGMRVALDILV